MSFKRILLLFIFVFTVTLFIPKTSKALDLGETLTSENSVFVKIQEGIVYFFSFGTDNKVSVLEKRAEKRLTMAQTYADQGNEDRVQDLMQNYLQIKEKQNILLGKTDNGEVLGAVAERTIEQQKTMEEIKNKIDVNGQQNVMQVQEKVVNQVAERIVVQNGTEGQTEFFNKVGHVWAPGTEPKDGKSSVSGVVIDGGTMQFAPGTSGGGGPTTNDIKTREVKTGGAPNNVPVNGDVVPSTTGDTPVNTVVPGGVDTSGMEGTTNVIDP